MNFRLGLALMEQVLKKTYLTLIVYIYLIN